MSLCFLSSAAAMHWDSKAVPGETFAALLRENKRLAVR